jgi:alginate O-acetyltransferase complex protein AlgI
MNISLIIPWMVAIGAAMGLPLVVKLPKGRRLFQFVLVIGALVILGFQVNAAPGWRLAASSLLFLYVMKGVVLLAKPMETCRATRAFPYLLFFSVWPGMAVEGLQHQVKAKPDDVRFFSRGLLFLYIGLALILADAWFEPHLPQLAAAWIGLIGLLAAIHFGISEILTALVRFLGWPVEPLFRCPERSRTLEDFWGRRWNLPFVEMDRRLFVRPLIRKLGPTGATVAIFAISGLLHELALSYPAGAGWGLPFSYFMLQAGGTWLQSKGWLRSRLMTYAIVLLPVPLLFHPAFLSRLPFQLIHWLNALLRLQGISWYLNILLWALGIAQLLPLAASFQVPHRLNWREDLPKLSPFNRKLMWTYGAFVVLTIISFSALTFVLHSELLRGDRAAIAFASFAAIYWTLRLLADTFYLKAEDWPKGAEFVLGHGLLNSLFAFLSLGYGAIVLWGVLY